jgi:hypothetical protein
MPVRRWSITTATAVADEARYVRIGWTDPALEGVPAQFELPERVLAEWQKDRRTLCLVALDGSRFDAQLMGFGPDALYVADQDGQARLVFRHGLREIILRDREAVVPHRDTE